MIPQVAVVCAAHTDLGKHVIRNLIRSPHIAHVYALSELDIRDALSNESSSSLRKLTLLIHPLDYLERTIASNIRRADLAFYCLCSPRHVVPSLGPYLYHKLNYDIPFRFLHEMLSLSIHSIALFAHPHASVKARSQFLRVKADLLHSAKDLQQQEPQNCLSRIVFLLVPTLISHVKPPYIHHVTDHAYNGVLPTPLSALDKIKQKAVMKHDPDSVRPLLARDVAAAMVADALDSVISITHLDNINLHQHSLHDNHDHNHSVLHNGKGNDSFMSPQLLRQQTNLFILLDAAHITDLARTARALRRHGGGGATTVVAQPKRRLLAPAASGNGNGNGNGPVSISRRAFMSSSSSQKQQHDSGPLSRRRRSSTTTQYDDGDNGNHHHKGHGHYQGDGGVSHTNNHHTGGTTRRRTHTPTWRGGAPNASYNTNSNNNLNINNNKQQYEQGQRQHSRDSTNSSGRPHVNSSSTDHQPQQQRRNNGDARTTTMTVVRQYNNNSNNSNNTYRPNSDNTNGHGNVNGINDTRQQRISAHMHSANVLGERLGGPSATYVRGNQRLPDAGDEYGGGHIPIEDGPLRRARPSSNTLQMRRTSSGRMTRHNDEYNDYEEDGRHHHYHEGNEGDVEVEVEEEEGVSEWGEADEHELGITRVRSVSAARPASGAAMYAGEDIFDGDGTRRYSEKVPSYTQRRKSKAMGPFNRGNRRQKREQVQQRRKNSKKTMMNNNNNHRQLGRDDDNYYYDQRGQPQHDDGDDVYDAPPSPAPSSSLRRQQEMKKTKKKKQRFGLFATLADRVRRGGARDNTAGRREGGAGRWTDGQEGEDREAY